MEHGSAKWGNVSEICRRYCEKQYTNNLLLTQHFRMGLDGYKHKRNLNVLVVGGSGAGKSRTYAIPNIMQCNCSMVITDPKAELLRKTGGVLERNGYEVRVFDLINPETSWCYNPFAYVRDDKDVLKLINNLIRNTTPKGAQSSDPFWEKSETALLQALMLYLLHEAPPEEQNFPMIMEMLGSAQVKEDDEDYQSPLDILFERLEMRDPESIAVKQYAIYKQAAGKTAKVYFDIGWCPSGSVQSETNRQPDLYGRTGLIQYWGEKSSTVLLYSGCRHQHELSGRHDLQ